LGKKLKILLREGLSFYYGRDGALLRERRRSTTRGTALYYGRDGALLREGRRFTTGETALYYGKSEFGVGAKKSW
jgi:hypothetical protein